MEPIYVTGHRNPDTDSIVSAMAYAALRNALGDRGFTASRLGHLNDETKRILERFDFQPPVYIKDMRTQVLDLDYDTPPALHCALTVARGWDTLRSDDAIRQLSEEEFFLSEATILQILRKGQRKEEELQRIVHLRGPLAKPPKVTPEMLARLISLMPDSLDEQ